MKFLNLLALTAIVTASLGAFAPGTAHAITGIADELGMSPFWKFKTIETEHFRIDFPEELSDTAEKTANYLEEAHALLSPVLYWQAHYKVNVLVIDNVDSENGQTSPILRFGIALYVTPPDNWESIAYYDNWLRELCIHEYTHFLNMDATRGIWQTPLRYLFGDVTMVNSLWPSWMLEGLAVYDETRFTLAGRGRSPFYEMILRSAVMENVLNSRKFITLDKVNGPSNPWYPAGETPYLFGYELMNQVANSATPDALGVLSKRSSWRVPFFINGNLENITGKDWYTTWDDLVRDTRSRADHELGIIRSAPVTSFTRLTHDGYDLYGPAISPDGNWIAYTHSGLNDISGLYLMNRRTGEVTRLLDKDGGVSLAFTRDSRFLFESRLHRITTYYLYSDIEVLDLEDGSTHWLTSKLRARDPALSPDEDWLAFTTTDHTTTRLAVAHLSRKGDGFKLGPAEILFPGRKYDRVATPQFSPDGRTIAFSLHRNGVMGEDIILYDMKTQRFRTAIADGSFNRYPTWDPNGHLYFVSDKTGVDNLYRYMGGGAAALVSNYETGVAFPTFSRFLGKNQYLATVFSTRGWDIALAELPAKPYSVEALKIPEVPAPKKTEKALDHAASKSYPIQDYSLWPTILPRVWSPLLAYTGNGAYLGGAMLGFDQADRNRYLLTGAYDTFVNKGDVFATYDNRYLGPTIEASASLYTSSEYAYNGQLAQYGRTQSYSLSAFYTFQNTYSSVTPSIAYNLQRETDYVPTGTGTDIPIAETSLVPNVSGMVSYSDTESSPLAILPERGRNAFIGSRVYMNSGDNVWKGLAADYEYITFGDTHIVLTPTLKGSWVSHTSPYQPADVLVQGRLSNAILNALATDSFDHLLIRGYPLQAFYTRAATVASADLNIPLWRIFAGPGTDPIFLQNLYGFVFGETTYFPAKDVGVTTLPSTGGGVHLGVDLTQNLPIDFSVQYQKGFQQRAGGTGEVFFAVGLSAALAPVYSNKAAP